MDDTNNTNTPNNLTPSSAGTPPPQPMSGWPPPPSSLPPTPEPVVPIPEPSPPAGGPAEPPIPEPTPVWTPPVQPTPEPISPMTESAWPSNPPATPTEPSIPEPTATWTPPVQPAPEPIPPQPEPIIPQPNPTPPQPEPAPTFMPPQTDQSQSTNESTIQPSWAISPETPPAPNESAPTDLSHLISNNLGQELPTQPAETLVAPPTQNNATETNSPVTHKGIPRWLIGLAIGLLISVAGASAYFIIGIGQPKTTTSVPAQVETQKTATQLPPPLPTSPPIQPASGSANFGELEGTAAQSKATSAGDLMRQQQGL